MLCCHSYPVCWPIPRLCVAGGSRCQVDSPRQLDGEESDRPWDWHSVKDLWGKGDKRTFIWSAHLIGYNAPLSGMPHYPYMGLMWGKVGICTPKFR